MTMRKLIALLLTVTMVFGMTAAASAAEAEATYTYNYATSVFPTNWSPFIQTSTADGELGGYLSVGFYEFDYDETGDSWAYVPYAAVDYPEDVTANYIGQYGLEEGDTYQAWKVTIRDDLKWDDGTPITAYDYVESLKRLLDPVAQNYVADVAYIGDVIIHNAENYLKSGQFVMENNYDGETTKYAIADLIKGEDGTYTTPEGYKVYIGLNQANNWIWGYTLTDYYGWGYLPDEGCWDVLTAAADEDGWIPVTDEIIAAVHVGTGSDTWGGETEEQVALYFSFKTSEYGETSWDEVGMFALSDYELVYVLDSPQKGFYLYYGLPCYLVKLDLYDSLATVTDGVYTNTYGTSAETSASCGPYKLVSFQMDKQYVLERNENYFGFTEDTYQTTSVVVDYVPEASTRLELFLQGKLDTYSLNADNLDTYSMSDYCYQYNTHRTSGLILNPDYDGLAEAQEAAGENINKTILTLVEFRQALSYALDRSAYNLATTPLFSVGIGLYDSLCVADPDAATSYRSTDAAKQVLAELYGVSEDYGEGKMYADIDEAIDSITGYNLEKAQELFNIAYDKAIEQGLMDEDDVVEIVIGLDSNDVVDKSGYEFLVNCFTEAVKGTKLEGKLTFAQDDTVIVGDTWQDAIRNNQIDMEFRVSWNGTALNPYSTMSYYVNPSWQWDDGTDYSAIDMTLAIDGVDYTTSVYDWCRIMMGNETEITAADGSTILYSCGAADDDPDTRVQILAALESEVLSNYNFIPTSYNASASLRGQQINYKTEEEIFMMGYGDSLKYITYNYTDAEWDAYVAENGGTLDYT